MDQPGRITVLWIDLPHRLELLVHRDLVDAIEHDAIEHDAIEHDAIEHDDIEHDDMAAAMEALKRHNADLTR